MQESAETAENQTSVTTANVKELVDTLCATMDRKFHRMEYNTVLSETTILDPRFKKLAFNDTKAFDEAIQRITTAAARFSQPLHCQGAKRDQKMSKRGHKNLLFGGSSKNE